MGFIQKDTVDTLRTMLAELKDAGFTGSIEFHYDGSGDSGDIHDPKIEPKMLGALHGLGYKIEYGNGGYTMNAANEWVRASQQNPRECILTCISELLPGGWEINEGSSGVVRLDIDTGTIRFEHNENEMVSNYTEWEV